MAYLYRHIRLDKNVPFYIGIGSDRNYNRAYRFTKRNNYWNRIYEKTEIQVEIVLDNLEWNEACKKEMEFIKLYGKYPVGTLCNMTDGGDGILGLKRNAVFCKRNSEIHRGKKYDLSTRLKMSRSHSGKILTLEHRNNISKATKGRKLSDEHKIKIGQKNKSINHGNWNGYIHQYEKNLKLVNIYDTLQKAEEYTNVSFRDISKVCAYYSHIENNTSYCYAKNHKSAGGFIWKRQSNIEDSNFHKKK